MLRCPPSRISLTSSDLNRLDERLAARQNARLAKQKASDIELTRGPRHPTSLSIVSAEDNIGRKRARSSASEATFYPDSNDQVDVTVASSPGRDEAPLIPRPSSASRLEASLNEPDSFRGAVRTLENVTQRTSPTKPQGRQQVAGLDSLGPVHAQPQVGSSSQLQVADSRDGALDNFVYDSPAQTTRVLGDIRGNTYPEAEANRQVAEPPPGRRLLSSARARRWRIRSQDFCISEDQQNVSPVDLYSNSRQDIVYGRYVGEGAPPVPELLVHDEDSRFIQPPSLDPVAPAFVPRSRFGTVTRPYVGSGTGQYGGPHWGSLDSTRNAPDLRIRPISEQNVEMQHARPHRQNWYANNAAPRPYPSHRRGVEHQGGILQSNQNTAAAQSSRAFERYPVWAMSPSMDAQYRASTHLRVHSGTGPRVVQSQHQAFPAFHPVPGQGHQQPHFRIYSAMTRDFIDTSSFPSRTRSASPAVSTISRSTPDLLSMPSSAPQVGCRESSWSWMQSHSRPPSQTRVASMVSGASGASREDPPRQSSRHELDAAEEFIRRRNSPLDELTEKFSRMRSVGRSWERTPGRRTRPSLLSGDPFGRGPATEETRTSIQPTVAPRSSSIPVQSSGEDEEDVTDADPVALSLALPPSSPLPSGAQIVPSSPPLPGSFPTSTRPALTQISPSKACDFSTSPIRRKPLPRTVTTPKINVYDDNQPPDTQLQTPADVAKSRRARNNSASAAQQSPVIAARAVIESSQQYPEGHASQDARSQITTTQAGRQVPTSSSATSEATVVANLPRAAHRERARTRAQTQRSSEQTENDVEGQLSGLEEDRLIWLSRHGPGTLDTTPPKEGRFEKFLS